jgi:hypothetical protein
VSPSPLPLDLWTAAGADAAVWRPADLDAIEELLVRRTPR